MSHDVDVCIVGAGPAGMVLGLLLARRGVRTLVLEQHSDFEREYRGEVLMPRFTQMMRQICLDELIESEHHLKLEELEGFFENQLILKIGFKEISPEIPCALWMPQPILLNALYKEAKNFSSFDLWFNASVHDLNFNQSQCVGVQVKRSNEEIEVKAKVTVGTDGRFSVVRREGGFKLGFESHRFDLIWFTIPKPAGYDNRVRFFLSRNRNYLILPKYPNHIQCGLVVEPGEFLKLHKNGIESLKNILRNSHPAIRAFTDRVHDFKPFNLLQAKIEMVKEWARDGVVLIGDSAHTCSPAGAIGVSVAVESAIAGAQVIWDAIQKKDVSKESLSRLQKLREEDVREIQVLQNRFSGVLFPRSAIMKWLLPFILPLFAKFGLFRMLQRKLFVLKRPISIDPAFFAKE